MSNKLYDFLINEAHGALENLPNLRKIAEPCSEKQYMHLIGYLNHELYGLSSKSQVPHDNIIVESISNGFFSKGYQGEKYCQRCGQIDSERVYNQISTTVFEINDLNGYYFYLKGPNEIVQTQVVPKTPLENYIQISKDGDKLTYSHNISGGDLAGKVCVFSDELANINERAFENCKIQGINIPANIEIAPKAFYNCTQFKILIFRGSRADWYKSKIASNWFIIETEENMISTQVRIGDSTIEIPENEYLRIYLKDVTTIPEYELVTYQNQELDFVYGEIKENDNNITVVKKYIGNQPKVLMYCNFNNLTIDLTNLQINGVKIQPKTMEGYPLQKIGQGIQLFVWDREDNNICYFYPEYPYYQ